MLAAGCAAERGSCRIAEGSCASSAPRTTRCSRLAPDDTLKPEVDGALNVPNLLKVVLKNEVEATEIAARCRGDDRRRRQPRPRGGRGQRATTA
jgi:hypothetical protein